MTALFEQDSKHVEIPRYIPVISAALETKLLECMARWNVPLPVQQDALKIIPHALAGYDDYPEDVQYTAEVPEIHLTMDLPPMSLDLDRARVALARHWESVPSPNDPSKAVPTVVTFHWSFVPEYDPAAYGEVTAHLRPDFSAWDVTLTEAAQ